MIFIYNNLLNQFQNHARQIIFLEKARQITYTTTFTAKVFQSVLVERKFQDKP